jgi:hypothetical protein
MFAILVVCLLVGCTSLHEKAEKHLLLGEYNAAASIYDEILAKTPNDALAIDRQKRARQKLIEDRLIEVRQQRLSDNFLDAIIKLDAIQKDEEKWGVSAIGVAFSTQSEETELLYRWFKNQVNDDLDSGKYLKAKVFFDKHESVFNFGSTRKKNSELKAVLKEKGGEHCAQMYKEFAGPYSAEFVKRYCMVWGKEAANKNRVPSSIKMSGLRQYGQVDVHGLIDRLPSELNSTISDVVLSGIKATPFYAADSQALKASVNGKYAASYREHQEVKVHPYTVEIPYQVEVTVPYMVSVPYTYYVQQYDYNTGRMYSVPQTGYNYETRFQNVMKTRYRTESRSFPFTVTAFDLTLIVVGKLEFEVDGVFHKIPLNYEKEQSDYFHTINNDEIGLHSKEKNVPNEVDWLKENFAGIQRLVKEKITESWENKYCKIPESLMRKTQIETVMKCLKGSGLVHDFVNNWFQANFSMSYKEVESAISAGSAAST